MIRKATPNGCSAHIPMPKDSIGRTFEIKEVKPMEDIKKVLSALEHDKDTQKIARKLLLGQ